MVNARERAIIDLDADFHELLQQKAIETGNSVSQLVNEAVRVMLAEDAEDLAAFEERVNEPNLPFESFIRNS